MTLITISLFISFCGLLGIFLRRNLLNISVSLLQVLIGLNAAFTQMTAPDDGATFSIYLIVFLIFLVIIFAHAIAVLMIKRRSTLHVNELTELRG